MSRRTVGALLVLTGALVYAVDWAAHHVGAMVFIANKTGDINDQYRIAVSLGEGWLIPLSIACLVVGIAYLVWAEVGPRAASR